MPNKPLTYYCSARKDEPIFRALEAELPSLNDEEKLTCAVIALGPSLGGRLLLSLQGSLLGKNLSPIKQTITRLTPGGRLELAKALIDQVHP